MVHFDLNFTVFCKGLITNKTFIGPENGLAPNKHQGIIWRDDGLFYECIYVLPCHYEFNYINTMVVEALASRR